MIGSKLSGIAALFATTLALGTMSAGSAAPVLSNAASLKSAVSSDVIEVRSRGAAVAAGVAAGLAVGAIAGAASRPYYDPYYGAYDAYYGAPAYYAAPVYDGPVYVAPAYRGRCFVPSDHGGTRGHYGPCWESDYRTRTNTPD